MAYYRVCPECGCTLDPGEPCDCQSRTKKEAAPAATGTTSGENSHPQFTNDGTRSQAERGYLR